MAPHGSTTSTSPTLGPSVGRDKPTFGCVTPAGVNQMAKVSWQTQADSHVTNPTGSRVWAHGQSWSLGMPGLTRWRTNIPSTLNITENSLRAISAL